MSMSAAAGPLVWRALDRIRRAFAARWLRVLLLCALVGISGLALWWASARQESSGAAVLQDVGQGQGDAEAAGPPPVPTVLVFVSGAVVHPGLYHLTTTARIADALVAAGGVTAEADPGRLPDEAAAVHDGHQVNVPFLGSGTRGGTARRLDLNTATLEELRSLPGMPAGLAEAIVDHRRQWGPFTSVGELRTVLGVDAQTASGLGRLLRVAAPAP